MWQQWVNLLLGLWVIVVPFIAMSGSTYTWTLVVTGIIIAALGLWGALETSSESRTGSMRTQH